MDVEEPRADVTPPTRTKRRALRAPAGAAARDTFDPMDDGRSTIPSLHDDDDSNGDVTSVGPLSDGLSGAADSPLLLVLTGVSAGHVGPIRGAQTILGRGADATLRLLDRGVSRAHARITAVDGGHELEDLGSANGTRLNGSSISGPALLADGDRIALGDTVVQFVRRDIGPRSSAASLRSEPQARSRTRPWTPFSWRDAPAAQQVAYDDSDEVEAAVARLRNVPPLVASWEVERLKSLIAEAQEGRRLFLQGGDCAESLADCTPQIIISKLKILMQMSLVLVHASRRPVIRVGRFAGQYAKPRSSPTERRGDVELPSYFGDLVNRPEFTPAARRPDPSLLLSGYLHAAATMNFIRTLTSGAFSDLRKPEYYDLSFFERADIPERVRREYERVCRELAEGLHLLRSVGESALEELLKVDFFSSHEGLHLLYESAQTRAVPRRNGYYDLSTHMPWIGERTRSLSGAHVEFFRGVANPLGVKLGPTASGAEVVELCRALNPANEPGKLVLITRMGVGRVETALPPLIEAVERASLRVLWVCDPMHGNPMTTRDGIKTRDFDATIAEVTRTIDVHEKSGTYFGGVHFELTGEDVTECVGGGLTEADLSRNYVTRCDPRLNYRQSIEMAFCIARRLTPARTRLSDPPPSSAGP